MQEISVIIPACDCAPDITLLKETLKGVRYEIIIEFDRYREGKGITLQRGFRKSTGDIIVWYDADGEIKPSIIPDMIKLLEHNHIVVGSKMHKDSKIHYPFTRYIISRVGHFIIKSLFGLPLSDTQTGVKVFRREVLEGDWKIDGFGHDVEVLLSAHKKGLRIVEVPVVVRKHNARIFFIVTLFNTLKEMLYIKRKLR